jgi:hypothetical protein
MIKPIHLFIFNGIHQNMMLIKILTQTGRTIVKSKANFSFRKILIPKTTSFLLRDNEKYLFLIKRIKKEREKKIQESRFGLVKRYFKLYLIF